ncbi:MAG: multidrug effflux MFS transporter [Sulfitobacter sp.]|nr:multidrug effflux MFS transporter [Sulfitobacter sp.]
MHSKVSIHDCTGFDRALNLTPESVTLQSWRRREHDLSSEFKRFPMGRAEFVALIAMMFATIAFSIDAMLPALPEIAEELSPGIAYRASLVLTTFVLGMGVGTFIAGPLSDAYGRRRVLFFGSGLYIVAAAVAWASSTLEVMLAARVVQGLGAAGPRVVAIAIVRDLYSGREMARIVSFVMMIFTIVPAFAPALGAVIILGTGWRGIFVAFIVFAIITIVWMGMRMPETLPDKYRRPLRPRLMLSAVGEIFGHSSVRLSIIVQSLAMAMLFLTLMMIQTIYAETFNREESFPYWFGVIALIAGSATILNAVLVIQYGMRRLVTVTLGTQVLISGVILALDPAGMMVPYGFSVFLVWQFCIFFQAGLTLGNLNAIAMEPMGHIAGIAASVIGAVSAIIAALLASAVAQSFPATVSNLIGGILMMSSVGFFLMLTMKRDLPQTEAAE